MAGWAAAAQGISDIGATTANAVLAAQTRKWMEHMRDTQYQATVKDLRRANLNPLMALGGGPSVAGVGTPPTPTVESPDIQGGFQRFLSASKQAKAMQDELDTIDATKDKAIYDADLSRSMATYTPKLAEMQIKESVQRALMLGAQAGESSARTVESGVRAALGRAEIPRAELDAKFYQSEYGEKARTAERVLDIFPLLRGAFGSGARR